MSTSLSLSVFKNRRTERAGLTLIELVVVMAVLVILASVIIPRIGGVQSQANSATDASIIADVNRAVTMYETVNKTANGLPQSPNGNDGLLTSNQSTTFYPKLHPNLQTSTSTTTNVMLPILYPVQLSDGQAWSLNQAGITSAHYNDDSTGKNATGMPSDSGVNWGAISTGSYVAGLVVPTQTSTPAWTSHGSTFPDRAFNLNPFNSGATDTFVVFGIGQPSSLRGGALVDSPIVQGANPSQYYARVLIVYRIPAASVPVASAPVAQYVGAFAPDGTCINDNIRNYNSANKSL